MFDTELGSLPFVDEGMLQLECAALLSLQEPSNRKIFKSLSSYLETLTFGELLFDERVGLDKQSYEVAARIATALSDTCLQLRISLQLGTMQTAHLMGTCASKVEKTDKRDPAIVYCLVMLSLFSLRPTVHDEPHRQRAIKSGSLNLAVRTLVRWFEATRKQSIGVWHQQSAPPPRRLDTNSSEWSAHDRGLVGDGAPFTNGLGHMFQTLEGWDAAWAMPKYKASSFRADPSHRAYWNSLVQMTLGRLGWSDPALGVARWILLGMPFSTPELALLRRHWGPRALMYFCHPQMDWIPQGDDNGRYFSVRTSGVRVCEVFERSVWSTNFAACGGLHMRDHVSWQLLGDQDGQGGRTPPAIFAPTEGLLPNRRVVLLNRFAGWYKELVDVGEELLSKGALNDLQLQMIGPPIGLIGTFQYSNKTAKWYSGLHEVHLLGQ